MTKSITLDGGGGPVASILVAGTNGIVVSVGATDVVILRNLRFDGLLGNGSNSANAGVNGIRFLSDRQLTIQNVNVFGLAQNCIDIEPSTSMAVISNLSVDNCGSAGILVKPGSGANVGVSIDRAMVFNTANGILANGTVAERQACRYSIATSAAMPHPASAPDQHPDH
jgi:hypothetical protein